MSSYFVIFGAMVRPDGTPSGTLRRRVAGALQAARGTAGETRFLVTGGQGRHGAAEADVMADLLLDQGIPDHRILRDRVSGDTLSQARHCASLLRARGDAEQVWVCSSPYHNPRCALLLRVFGVPARIAEMPGDRAALGTGKWLYYLFRELLATPWDLLLALLSRGTGRS